MKKSVNKSIPEIDDTELKMLKYYRRKNNNIFKRVYKNIIKIFNNLPILKKINKKRQKYKKEIEKMIVRQKFYNKFLSKNRFNELLQDQNYLTYEGDQLLYKDRVENSRVIIHSKAPKFVNIDGIDEHNENINEKAPSMKKLINNETKQIRRNFLFSDGLFNMNRYQANVNKIDNKIHIRNIIRNYK